VSENEESKHLVDQAGRSRRASTYARRVLFVVLSILVSFIFYEVSLRLFWHNPYRNELPERVLRLPLNHARADHVVNRATIYSDTPTVRFRTDERSYVLPSRRFDVPDVTIAFLGGSTTENIVVQEELRFPARVSYLLEKKGLKVNTLNAGKSGNTTHDSINVLLNHVVQDKPDVVVLMEATNDIGILQLGKVYDSRMGTVESFSHSVRYGLQSGSSTFYLMGLMRKLLTVVDQRPTEMIRPERQRREKRRLPNDEYEKRLRAFVRISRAFGMEPVLMTQPLANIRNALTPDWVDPLNQEVFNYIVRKVGAEEDAIVIDLVRHLIEDIPEWNQPMKIFYDGVHVNDSGSEVYARFIAERLYDEVLTHRLNRAARVKFSVRQ
jgi:lysophospholipase L1-like esterase